MAEILTAEQIRESIIASLHFHLTEAEKLQEMLSIMDKKSPAVTLSYVEPFVKATPITAKKTFRDIVIDTLVKTQAPHLTRNICDFYRMKTGQDINRKDMSSRLSIEAKKGRIFKIELKDQPNNLRHWWVLSEWIGNDGNLLPKYQREIDETIRINKK